MSSFMIAIIFEVDLLYPSFHAGFTYIFLSKQTNSILESFRISYFGLFETLLSINIILFIFGFKTYDVNTRSKFFTYHIVGIITSMYIYFNHLSFSKVQFTTCSILSLNVIRGCQPKDFIYSPLKE